MCRSEFLDPFGGRQDKVGVWTEMSPLFAKVREDGTTCLELNPSKKKKFEDMTL